MISLSKYIGTLAAAVDGCHREPMDVAQWTQTPDGWSEAPADVLAGAKRSALDALSTDSDRPAHERLADFYDRSGDCAGASFTELGPFERDDITAVDLHATTLLSVNIGPGATRRLLHPSVARHKTVDALRAIPDSDLLVAGPRVLQAMESLYLNIKAAISGPTTENPDDWEAASKLCARKRPNLFPVRNEVVCGYLGLRSEAGRDDYRVDWQVFRALISDRDLMEAIDRLTPLVSEAAMWRKVQTETTRLRILDTALSTWVRSGP